MISRGFRYRLWPTEEQDRTLRQWVGVERLVYNLALEQRETWWRQYRAATGGNLNFVSQGRGVIALRAEYDWIQAVSSTALTQALRDLDRAFANFFAGRARFPNYRRRGVDDTFRIGALETQVRRLNARWSAVRVPKVGWVKMRHTRDMRGEIVNATYSRDALGWHVSFCCKIEHEEPANDNPAIGIDRGVAVSLAMSNGETFQIPARIAKLDRRRRAAQRVLTRRKKGSNRRRKQLHRVARIGARITHIRADWQHRVSRSIADRFGLVAIEALKVVNMTAGGRGKRGLNRSILNQGWNAFATRLAYKLEERGGALVTVSPAYTSQTCSACGTVDARNRKSQSAFCCVECGHAENADVNAAKIILRRSTASMPAEGSGCAPDEAGTMLEAA